MNLLTLTTLSFGMAMDAFAVAIAKGASNPHPRFFRALQGGLFFGVVEGIAPFIGYYLGRAAENWVQAFDHWLAFGLLGVLGLRFIYGAIKTDNDEQADASTQNFALMLITAIATSIDSVVVGASLAFLDVNIYLACALIGLATTIMATGGLYLGNRLGAKFGRYAMGVGGLVLIGIGGFILMTHLSGGG